MTDRLAAAAIVLAAGGGTRMKSTTNKVLHEIAGRSLVGHAIAAVRELQPEHVAVVVRAQRDQVAAHVASIDPGALIVDQDDLYGTGRAVACGVAALPEEARSGTIVVTYGDAPLLQGSTLQRLVEQHAADHNAITALTAVVDNPTGYGRIVRAETGGVMGIVEHVDATDQQREIREINSGIYAFDGAVLVDALGALRPDNAQGEWYLTDVLGIVAGQGHRVGAMVTDDVWQTEGVNDRVQLATLRRVLNERITKAWMLAGVTIIDPATTWIDIDVELAADVTIHPNTQLHGSTKVAGDVELGPDTTLTDCEVGMGASVVRTQAVEAVIGAGATVGPFTYLRPGTRLAAAAKAGGFVEMKNADIGPGAKVPHLSYVGDADVGEGTNIGAGVIFANYDGVAKHHTSVGRHSFVGSDSVVVAPRVIGDGVYVAAGSTVVTDIDPGHLAVARGRQRNIAGWVERKRAGTETAQAAAEATQSAHPAGSAPTEPAEPADPKEAQSR